MLRIALVLLFFSSFFLASQIHNRLLKINVGATLTQFAHKNTLASINDTSSHQFDYVFAMPAISYSHEFVINDVLSISGKVGFQYMNIYYDNQYYGSPFTYISVGPQLSLFYRLGFEYYIKLHAGASIWFHHTEIITDQMRRLFPDRANMFTGVTLGGFNYFISDQLGLNLELSIWSPEMATFGISYRFFKGELPTIQETKEL